MLSLNQLLEKAHGLHASDVHLVCGLPSAASTALSPT